MPVRSLSVDVTVATVPRPLSGLDMPTVMRNQPQKAEPVARAPEEDGDYLDIPAFLRRQAD